MEINNNLSDIDFWEPINSSQLSYKHNIGNEETVSKIANTNITVEIQYGIYEGPALKTTPKSWDRDTFNNKSNSIL